MEIEVLDKDILEIGYLIENKKIRLDFDEFGIGEEFEIKQIKFLKLNLDRKK